MGFSRKLTLIVVFSISLAVSLGVASAQTSGGNGGSFVIPGGLVPDNNATGPVANVGAEYKFDDGFYQKIQDLILAEPQAGDFGVHDGVRYYNVIMVVSRDDGDDRGPDETAEENKNSIVRYLNTLGARNVVAAESLSFVTGSIPVADIPGISLREEIYQMGDGEMPLTPQVDTARRTIDATPSDLRQSIGRVLNGTGVTVAVIDTGIDSIYLDDKITDQTYCHYEQCGEQPILTRATHGTWVAQIIAASGMRNNNGISPGVTLLDAMYAIYGDRTTYRSSNVVHAIDWSYSRGADVVNLSLGQKKTACGVPIQSFSMVINEAVDKGMVVVNAAGNDGEDDRDQPVYASVIPPGCAHNAIAVGGINDRSSPLTMAQFSSRGPISNSDPRLVPHIAAPAARIPVLNSLTSDSTSPDSGTSFAAPQVSAVAAMLLQASPELTPAEVKAALLLGADWKGPIPCTSVQYEQNNASDPCSYARQPADSSTANNAASLEILNNVGFGVLDAAKSLGYVNTSSYIISDHLDSDTTSKWYWFRAPSTSDPVKIILTWMAHPHGGIAEQLGRSGGVPIADLNLDIIKPGAWKMNVNSAHQTTEFAVLNPSGTGNYAIKVYGSGLDSLNKPVQAFTLASTSSLNVYSSSNQPPVTWSGELIVGPGIETPVRLSATDPDDDTVTFHVSRDPAKGTVTASEVITETVSRVIYTPDDDFAGTDTFQVTPHDGLVSGTAATITLSSESLPAGATSTTQDSANVRDWDARVITRDSDSAGYSEQFAGRSYPVSALYVGSTNMEAADLAITATDRTSYTVAVPSDGERKIRFETPITIQSATLSADAINEEAADNNQGSVSDYEDIRMYVGYVPNSCSASGAASACPSSITYTAVTEPGLTIPDGTGSQDAVSAMQMPENGILTALSVSVDIDHNRIGDLKVILTSPSGTQVTLHDRTDGSRDYIRTTYRSSSSTPLAGLAGSEVDGTWTLSVGDYSGSYAGVLNSWTLNPTYMPDPVAPDTQRNTEQHSPSVIAPNIGDSLTITAVTSATKGTINTDGLSSGYIIYTPSRAGIDTINYTVSDDWGNTDRGTISIYNSAQGNTRPWLDHIHNMGARVGERLAFNASGTDADSNTLTFDIANAPDGATINATTGSFTWTPSDSQNGIHTITVIVDDGRGGADWQDVTITVLRPDEINRPPVPQNVITEAVIGELKSIRPGITDPENDETTIISVSESALGSVTDAFLSRGIVVYLGGELGSENITYTVSDGRGGTATGTVSITVVESTTPP